MIDPTSLPDAPGLYRLWLDLPTDARIRVGALGEISFAAGRYAYTGSAMRGIRARVARHLRADSPLRWHIDYLLRHAGVVHVETFPHAGITECALNAEGLEVTCARFPVARFGAGDCRCTSHLIWTPPGTPAAPSVRTVLPSGEAVRVRLVRPDDSQRLGAYFLGLSDRTKSRYGPHAFDQATADAFCASVDPARTLRVIATTDREGDEKLIAYLIVDLGTHQDDADRYAALGITLVPSETATLAPCVADDYQNKGVASAVMPHLLTMVRSVGVRRLVLWGGVIADNHLGQGFYTKWGFRKVGEFTTTVLNFDMMAEIG